MRHQRLYSLFLLLGIQPMLMLGSQAAPQQRLTEIAALEKNAQPAAAVTAAEDLLRSPGLSADDQGKAWNIMGLAYDDEGNISACERSYGEALRYLQGESDRAAVFDNLGEVYHQTGQQERSEKLRHKALDLYRQAGDHEGMAIANNNLAAVAFARHQLSKGQSYLKEAFTESKLAPGLSPDDMAGILSLQAYLDGTRGDLNGAIVEYERALTLWRQTHSPDHPSVGWGEVLLASAHDRAGHTQKALAEAQQGLAILRRSPGQQSRQYIDGELAYARILDHAGAREEAMRIQSEAESSTKDMLQRQCTGCTISVAAFQ
jgi:tetratricopeptide (TPR) repeat protein